MILTRKIAMMRRMMKRQKNMMEKTTSKQTYEETQLAESIFELGILFASEEFEDGKPRSSLLVYFSGVLGLSDD